MIKEKHGREPDPLKYKRDTRGQQAIRICLRCRKPFKSEHRGNRSCKRCTEDGYRCGDSMDHDYHVHHVTAVRSLHRGW